MMGMLLRKLIKIGRLNWRKLIGIICDKTMVTKLKGKLYKSAVGLAVLYGMKTMPLTKVLEGKLNSAEMRMLRFIKVVTNRNKI